MSEMSDPERHQRRSSSSSAKASDATDASNSGDAGGGIIGSLPVDGRRLRRHQKVRLWLSTFHDQPAASASSATTAGDHQKRRLTAPTFCGYGKPAAAWNAFDDSGTFSADSCMCDESQVRLYSSTERSTILRNASNAIEPRSQESPSIASVSSKSTPTSLNKLLLRKMMLLSCSTPSTQEGESYSVKSQGAVAATCPAVNYSWHNSPLPAQQGKWPAQDRVGSDEPAEGSTSESNGKMLRSLSVTGSQSEASPSSSGRSTKLPLSKFIDDKGSQKPQEPQQQEPQQQEPQQQEPQPQEPQQQEPHKLGMQPSSDTVSVDLDNPQKTQDSYHVRVLPSMCYLVWRPNMLRRECMMDRGQAAYLNVLHPSALPMERLMSAVAARLDIEVPLLDGQRAGYDVNKVPKFEYVFRWHTPNGPRVQIADRITGIEHPAGQTGDPKSPVMVFISGSPGWLAKAK